MSDTSPSPASAFAPDTTPQTTVLPARPSTLPYAYSAMPPSPDWADEPPLPSVGDFWDVGHPDPVAAQILPTPAVAPIVPAQVIPAPLARRRPIVAPAPYVPTYLPTKTAPAVSWAFTSALASIPLLFLCGAGAILGVLAVILGIVGVARVNSSDRYRGTGRAAASIAIGLSTTLVGTPIMLLTMAVLGAL